MHEIYIKAKVRCDVCSAKVKIKVPLQGTTFKLSKDDLAYQMEKQGWHHSEMRDEYVCGHCIKEYS